MTTIQQKKIEEAITWWYRGVIGILLSIVTYFVTETYLMIRTDHDQVMVNTQVLKTKADQSELENYIPKVGWQIYIRKEDFDK